MMQQQQQSSLRKALLTHEGVVVQNSLKRSLAHEGVELRSKRIKLEPADKEIIELDSNQNFR